MGEQFDPQPRTPEPDRSDPRFTHLKVTLKARQQGADGEYRRGCRAIEVDPDNAYLPPGDSRVPILKTLFKSWKDAYEKAAKEYGDDADKIVDRAKSEDRHREIIKAIESREFVVIGTGTAAAGPSLDKEAVTVLNCLAQRQPALCTLDDIENVSHLSRATASKSVNYLIEIGYASRPMGERKGATLTDAGRAIAAQLNT